MAIIQIHIIYRLFTNDQVVSYFVCLRLFYRGRSRTWSLFCFKLRMDGLGDLMKTSIVILTHNHLEVTKLCIESIRQYTNPQSYELIVVDNASTDGTPQWLLQQQDIRSIFNPKNEGFPAGCNQGMRVATGDNTMLLNNDVVVTKGWLDNLLKCLYSQDDIGAVGPVTNRCAYYQTIPVNYQNLDEMQSFANEHNQSNPALWEERLKLIGYAFLFRRSVYEKVGELDEIFSPGNFEDDDFSLRIRQVGYKLMFCKDTFIHHFGSVSFNEKPVEYQNLLKINEEKFVRKWGFDSQKTMAIRYEILPSIRREKFDQFSLLEIGCGCGGTLLQLKNNFPNSSLYGYDILIQAAEQASPFAQISTGEWERFPSAFIHKKFDYIVINNVLERITKPISFLKMAKDMLHSNGSIILTSKNLSNIQVIEGLIKGVSPFSQDELRYYTLNELVEMLQASGFSSVACNSQSTWLTKTSEELLKKLVPYANDGMETAYRSYEYILNASSGDQTSSFLQQIEDIRNEKNVETHLKSLHVAGCDWVIEQTLFAVEDKIAILNLLAVKNFEFGYLEDVIPYLQKAFELDANHLDTLHNLYAVMEFSGESELAEWYGERIEELTNTDTIATKEPMNNQELKFLLHRIEFGVQTEDAVEKLVEALTDGLLSLGDIIDTINRDVIYKEDILNLLAVICYENHLHEEVIPLLQMAYEINRFNPQTLYNLATVMDAYGEKELALSFAQQVEEPDEMMLELIAAIKGV